MTEIIEMTQLAQRLLDEDDSDASVVAEMGQQLARALLQLSGGVVEKKPPLELYFGRSYLDNVERTWTVVDWTDEHPSAGGPGGAEGGFAWLAVCLRDKHGERIEPPKTSRGWFRPDGLYLNESGERGIFILVEQVMRDCPKFVPPEPEKLRRVN